jgi:hypothetical protein
MTHAELAKFKQATNLQRDGSPACWKKGESIAKYGEEQDQMEAKIAQRNQPPLSQVA